MPTRKKDPDDFEENTSENLPEKILEAFRDNPRNPLAKLAELGLEYCDDEFDEEELEEQIAEPENHRQQQLVTYFENNRKPSPKILQIYSEEKASESPNIPLIRKYYRAANPNLKALLLYGLENYPGRIDLLPDLAFFHEFENVLGKLITYYTRECLAQANLETFTELIRDFYYATCLDGYEAYHALRELYGPETAEREIIDFLIAEEEETNNNCPVN